MRLNDIKLLDIIKHAQNHETQAPLFERLIDIYSGNLNEYVKQSISTELSKESYAIASKRIPSINVLEKITDKLSKCFDSVPNRTVSDVKERDILNQYIQSIDIQSVMSNAELLLNLNKNFALEPYINDMGLFSVRVLAPHEFTVYSDDSINPKNPTAFIKFMGSELKGKKTVSRYWIYTNETFLDCNSDGDVYNENENPYGVLPFVYCTSDSFKLQPRPDIDTFENTILIPKLLTDLNFAAQFQSHSIMYGIDVDTKNLSGGPDAFWSIKSEEGTDKKPSIGILSPTVDVNKILDLITFTINSWLDSKGIKTNSGNVGAANPMSAVSKIIDEADASSIVQSNRILLVKAEQSLWNLIAVIHNTFLDSDRTVIKTGLSEPLNVSISFPTSTPIQDPAERRNELEFKLKNKLISFDRALKEANPDLSEDELLKLKKEIQNENQTN